MYSNKWFGFEEKKYGYYQAMVNMASIMVMVNDTAMVMDMENNLVRKNKSIDNQDILKLIMSQSGL